MSVTLIIAAYNAEATIARAIASALAQYEVRQVIVVDDASTDDTAIVARAADDGTSRLTIIQQDKNTGPAAARNRAIDIATGEWIGVLDADDFLLSGRIAGLLGFTEKADFVADDMWQVDEAEIDGPKWRLLDNALDLPRFVNFDEFVLSNVTRGNRQRGELGFIKPLMRRSFLIQHNLCYREEMRLGEDFELYARALALGARLILVPAQGYVSVVRADSLSGRHSEIDLLHLRDSAKILASQPSLTTGNKAALRRQYLSVDCRLQWRLLINAVKTRDVKAAIAAFLRPWPVPLYLMRRLAEQAHLRLIKR